MEQFPVSLPFMAVVAAVGLLVFWAVKKMLKLAFYAALAAAAAWYWYLG